MTDVTSHVDVTHVGFVKKTICLHLANVLRGQLHSLFCSGETLCVMVETVCRVVRCSDVTIQISVFIITVIDIYTIVFGSHIILTMYSIHLDQDCVSCKFRSIEFEHFVCDICTMQRIPALGDSTLGSLGESACASSGIRPFQARMNLCLLYTSPSPRDS